MKTITTKSGRTLKLGARFDQFDERDYRYSAPVTRLPRAVDHSKDVIRIMNQGAEGSCTGHAICAAAEMIHGRRLQRRINLSQRWAYAKARQIDEWPGENYHGSSTRAAVRAWAEHGICEESFWKYDDYELQEGHPEFDLVAWEAKFGPKEGAAKNARKYPLTVYRRCRTSYEIKHAINSYGVVVVGANVHSGWDVFDGDDVIAFDRRVEDWGGHAFIVVGYDEEERAYTVANSWGESWGKKGFAKLSYDDARVNFHDVWSVAAPE